jgi:hypothetical protein
MLILKKLKIEKVKGGEKVPKEQKKPELKKRKILKTSAEIVAEVKKLWGKDAVVELPEERERAPKWDTEKAGDYFIGEVSRLQKGPFGMMLFMRNKAGEEYLIPNRQALLMEPLVQRATVGDRLLITCLGKEFNPNSGQHFIAYQVQKISGGPPF